MKKYTSLHHFKAYSTYKSENFSLPNT